MSGGLNYARRSWIPWEVTPVLTRAIDEARLAQFLVAAKKATYAARGDDASVTPLLNGSKQLEFRDGQLFYRDVYFGSSFFVGQEVVELANRPIWSMSYAGGTDDPTPSGLELRLLYTFLREALQRVIETCPYRGPPIFRSGPLVYRCEVTGTVANFRGHETITDVAREVYTLTFLGGLLR
jgi:hypothetical protein